ncbi:hypothetical protein AgCh_017294 [Apium graveolens]
MRSSRNMIMIIQHPGEAPPPKISEDGDLWMEGIVKKVNESDFKGLDGVPEPYNTYCKEVHVEIDLDPRIPEAEEITGAVGSSYLCFVCSREEES